MDEKCLISMTVPTDGAVPATLQAKNMQRQFKAYCDQLAQNGTPIEIDIIITGIDDDDIVSVEMNAKALPATYSASGQAMMIAKKYSNGYCQNGDSKISVTDLYTAAELEYSLNLIFDAASLLPAGEKEKYFQAEAEKLQATVPASLYQSFTMRRNDAWVAITRNTSLVNFGLDPQ